MHPLFCSHRYPLISEQSTWQDVPAACGGKSRGLQSQRLHTSPGHHPACALEGTSVSCCFFFYIKLSKCPSPEGWDAQMRASMWRQADTAILMGAVITHVGEGGWIRTCPSFWAAKSNAHTCLYHMCTGHMPTHAQRPEHISWARFTHTSPGSHQTNLNHGRHSADVRTSRASLSCFLWAKRLVITWHIWVVTKRSHMLTWLREGSGLVISEK